MGSKTTPYLPKTKAQKASKVDTTAPKTSRETAQKKEETPDPFGSSFEYRTYRALKKLGWKDSQIEPQYSILGGRYVMGGQVMDFVLYGGGRTIPVRCQGTYWHKDASKEMYNAFLIEQEFKAPPVDLLEQKCKTDDDTYREVLRLIGRP